MKMTQEEAIAAVAQGAINIDEGLEVIEKGSRVHRGMHEICRILNEKQHNQNDPRNDDMARLTHHIR